MCERDDNLASALRKLRFVEVSHNDQSRSHSRWRVEFRPAVLTDDELGAVHDAMFAAPKPDSPIGEQRLEPAS